MRRWSWVGAAVAALALSRPAGALAAAAPPAGTSPPTTVVDAFEDLAAWSARPADGVQLEIRPDSGFAGRSMRLDFDFGGGGGYAVAHRAVDLDLPENYAFTFRIRGACRPNHLEFKLIDASGENVWWSVRRDLQFPREWRTFRYKKRQIAFAWGPAGGGEIRHVAAIEFAVTAGGGGRGSVWIDDLEITPLPPPGATPPSPVARASSAAAGHAAALAADGDTATAWISRPGDPAPTIELDLGMAREFGGLVVDWAPRRAAASYDVALSDDGAAWAVARSVRGGNGGRDWLLLPESESRHLRISVRGKGGAGSFGIREITLEPLEWGATRESFFAAIAGEAPRGLYPRGMSGEQPYWTLVGVDGGHGKCLFGEDGAIEVGAASFSIEPFLYREGRLLTWSDIHAEQWLEDGHLPIPSVRWPGGIELTVTAFGSGGRDSSAVFVRYRVANRGTATARATLYLAVRPFQVNPPAQFLNLAGGCAPIHDLRFDGNVVRVDGRPRLAFLTHPTGAGAVTFDQGDIVADYLRAGRLPVRRAVVDSFGAASGAAAYLLDLPRGAEREIDLMIPVDGGLPRRLPATDLDGLVETGARFQEAVAAWRETLDRVTIELPGPGRVVADALKAQLGWILLSRDGPALQPGVRSYARSWIRDGALMAAALLRTGHAGAAREFVEWFAPHQYATGKIPCVVDRRGADPVPEHDSSGEFIFVVADIWRHTGDSAFARAQWPRVLKAVTWLDSLRHERRRPKYAAPGQREFYGILPPSISHEGYSAKPMHSYWDDFWALKGFRDAAGLGGALGEPGTGGLMVIRDEFTRDFYNSIGAAMERHGIDYIPGCADLGDFDATSTSIALDPTGADDVLPPALLERTFDRYAGFVSERAAANTWDVFTPYEWRNVGALVRLGRRERALELLDFLMAYRRPSGWQVWAEVVGREERRPRFIGDMPHAWVGSDFVRSVLDMLAFERGRDGALVLGAGLPLAWLVAGEGVRVERLPTPFGELSYSMRADSASITVRIGAGLRIPRGGIIVAAPGVAASGGAVVNGAPAAVDSAGRVAVRELPATVTLSR